MSYKNLLQEYFQKKRLALPHYATRSTVSKDAPSAFVWTSVVTLFLPASTQEIAGNSEKTKTEAEQSAAKLALQFLEHQRTTQPKLTTKLPTAVFIDGENCPVARLELFDELGEGYTIYTFASVGHPSLKQPTRGDADVLIPVSSSRKDAVDISISMHLGAYLVQPTYLRYIVITKDHFGACIPECVDATFRKRLSVFSLVTISHVSSVSDFLEGERYALNNK